MRSAFLTLHQDATQIGRDAVQLQVDPICGPAVEDQHHTHAQGAIQEGGVLSGNSETGRKIQRSSGAFHWEWKTSPRAEESNVWFELFQGHIKPSNIIQQKKQSGDSVTRKVIPQQSCDSLPRSTEDLWISGTKAIHPRLQKETSLFRSGKRRKWDWDHVFQTNHTDLKQQLALPSSLPPFGKCLASSGFSRSPRLTAVPPVFWISYFMFNLWVCVWDILKVPYLFHHALWILLLVRLSFEWHRC